jgi:hypothetical protein
MDGRADLIRMQRSVILGLLSVAMCSYLLAGCMGIRADGPVPSIEASGAKQKTAFRVRRASPYKDLVSIMVWSHTRDVNLWEVVYFYDAGAEKRKELIEYGVIQQGQRQVLPKNGEAPPPMEEGEQIGIRITYSDARVWGYRIGSARKSFRYRNGRLVPDEPSSDLPMPRWSSVEQRQQFRESIRQELEPGP